jgi:hypothetical protein
MGDLETLRRVFEPALCDTSNRRTMRFEHSGGHDDDGQGDVNRQDAAHGTLNQFERAFANWECLNLAVRTPSGSSERFSRM